MTYISMGNPRSAYIFRQELRSQSRQIALNEWTLQQWPKRGYSGPSGGDDELEVFDEIPRQPSSSTRDLCESLQAALVFELQLVVQISTAVSGSPNPRR